MLLVSTGSALAQSYYFTLSKEVVNVLWNEDGTMSIDYVMDFQNQPGAHVIDFVDLGLPNSNYDINSISADVNGNPVTDISSSGYQGKGSGVAIGLGTYSIQPGGSGQVHVFIGKVDKALFVDSNDSNYVSGNFAPSYFDSQYVAGTTDLTVTFHFPKAVQQNEPRWHAAPDNFPSEPTTAYDNQDRIIYTWENSSASAAQEYVFGASFPKKYAPNAVVQTNNPFASGINIPWGALLPVACIGFFALIIGASLYGDQKRRLQYLPPKIAIEGNGIKRGLTAVEAAILMEEPLDKILTMILFSVIKKNAAQVVKKEPLEIKPIEPLPADLNPYEVEFITAFTQTGLERRKGMQEMMVNLVKSVQAKMKGFSRKETVAYYKDIMEKAWSQVEAAGTPEVKSQKFDEVMEWTMLDRRFNDRTRDVFSGGPVFVPIWWGHFDPGYGHTVTTSGPAPSAGSPGGGGGGGGLSMPTLPGSQFAGSIVGGIQNTAAAAVGSITDFTSRITNQTNPVPKPAASSGGSRGGGLGGGGSHCVCACACACAGCACACAGGGR